MRSKHLRSLASVSIGALLTLIPLAAPPATAIVGPDWVPQPSATPWALKGISFFGNCNGWAVGEEPGTKPKATTFVRTTDGGQTWTAVPTGLKGLTLNRVQFLSATIGWAVGENLPDGKGGRPTILKTSDAGNTWTNQSKNAPAAPRSFKVQDIEGMSFISTTEGWIAESLYKPGKHPANQGRILHTNDAGTTWTSQPIPDPTDAVADVNFPDANNGWAITDSGKILHSTNGGSSWAVQFDLGSSGESERVRFLDANNGVVSTGTDIYWTDDAGANWHLSQIATGEVINDIAYPDATHLWVVGEGDSAVSEAPPILQFSSNGGSSFTPQTGAPGVDLSAVTAVGTNAWAAGKSGMIISTLANPCGGSPSDTSPWYPQPSLSQSNMHGIFFVDSCNGWAVGEETTGNTQTMRTTDGGVTWSLADTGISGLTLNRVQFTTPLTGWAVGENAPDGGGGRGTILMSIDGGASWIDQTTNAPAGTGAFQDFEGLSFISSTEGWIAQSLYSNNARSGRILHTSNAGTSWTPQTIPNPGDPVADVNFVDASNGWAATDSGKILHTTDGGTTWTKQFNSKAEIERIRFADPLHGIAVAGSGFRKTKNLGHFIWRTSDGGAHWRKTNIHASASATVNDIAYPDLTHLWIVGEGSDRSLDSEPPTLMYSADGGVTWQNKQVGAPGLTFNGVTALADRVWATGAGGVVISNTAGACI